MNRETLTALSLASLTVFTLGGPAWAQQQPPPQYPPPGYPPPAQYPPGYPPPQPQRPPPPPGYPQQPPQPAQPPGYPPQPAYPPGYPPPRPAQPQAPAPGYPPPQQPAPQYPPQPGYPPQQPQPGYPPGYPPQQPQYPPQYPQQPPGAPGYQQPGFPPPAYDPYGVPGAKPPNQHLGFMIRLAAGPNYTTTGWSQSGSKFGSTGFGGFFNFAVGAAFIENFCLYGEFTTYTMLSGNYKYTNIIGAGGVRVTGEEDTDDKYYQIGVGPGASYYIMPINLYVGGSIQMAFLRGDVVKYGTDNPDVGFAFNFDAGKEFWATEDWGVGVNSRFSVARNGVKDVTHNTFTFGVGFVATFN